MTVVHCKKAPFDVYIGRGSIWGNPFKISADCTREQAIAKYRVYLWEGLCSDVSNGINYESLSSLHELRLGCYCSPKACHGDVLLRAAAYAHKTKKVWGLQP